MSPLLCELSFKMDKAFHERLPSSVNKKFCLSISINQMAKSILLWKLVEVKWAKYAAIDKNTHYVSQQSAQS